MWYTVHYGKYARKKVHMLNWWQSMRSIFYLILSRNMIWYAEMPLLLLLLMLMLMLLLILLLLFPSTILRQGYAVLGLTSFIVWIVGSYLLQLAYFCSTTSPGLYQYTQFLVVVYWLGFVIVILSVVNMRFGLFVTILIKQQMRPETVGR